MSAEVILYGAPGSGHAYKVRMALMIAGVAHQYRAIDLSAPRTQRDPQWRQASRFGEVPVLVWGGQAISQSNAILLHLMRRGAAPGAAAEPDSVTEWLGWEANRIGLSLPNARAHLLGLARVEPAVAEWLDQRLRTDLAVLEERLTEGRWLASEQLTVADLSCSAYLFLHDTPGLNLKRWPRIYDWLARISRQPGWVAPASAMRAYPAQGLGCGGAKAVERWYRSESGSPWCPRSTSMKSS